MADATRHGEESVKLFVGQVPKQMTESQLLELFQQYALVEEVNIIKDKTTRASRGCCFVKCPSREEADKAVYACHNKKTLPGAASPLQVKYADGELERLEHKLFVGMLPKNVTEVEVSDLFSQYGDIKDLQILRGSQQTNKGCAFLKYEKKEQAVAAIEALNGNHRMEGSTVPLVVKWADTEKERLARRAQKAQSQPLNMANVGSPQHPSLFGTLPMGYIPPYNGYGYQVDLVGGYYDAGDNVKFGFPMAFTTTMLSWSVIEFGGMMKSELQNAREAIRWSTDYLLKATVHPDTIYVQVGDANKDHACWERPEDMDTPRTVVKIDKNNPGTEVAAETAAALAAASLFFRRTDRTYSKLLATRAIRVFAFANKYRGAYSNGLKKWVCPFYCDFSGYQDELLWGAAWLHCTATKNPMYLNYIQANGQTLGADEGDNTFGWDNKHVGARILLSKAFLVQKVQSLHDYKGHADSFICSLIPQSQYTPGGLLFKMDDSNMQYVTSTSFLLVTYAKYLTTSQKVVNCGGTIVTPKKLRTLAKQQVDYLLGDNPLKMSYMVGYGPRYPQRIHHRGSSLPSIASHPSKIQCTAGFSVMNTQSPNPNIHVGAVVGGPDGKDRFPDQRSDYFQSEPATYINAPLVGSLAYLAHSFGQI